MYGNPPHCLGAYRHTPLHINGIIKNFANQTLYLYKCYKDTLLIIDSTKTDNNGKFQFSLWTHGNTPQPVRAYGDTPLPKTKSITFTLLNNASQFNRVKKTKIMKNLKNGVYLHRQFKNKNYEKATKN
jgi:hypothetical protein